MQIERFGYFRFKKRGKVHYMDEVSGMSTLRSLCGRDTVRAELIPVGIETAEKSLCKACRRVIDAAFPGWDQML
jgi:hypothetical protein